eukprot:GGOE01020525.1.p1 GENE.GGOE01020525.1~~GGOE01020525.1.p1  ORF type:complete len:805 (-),score=168.57 GGOE01020525.1:187-2601(-)
MQSRSVITIDGDSGGGQILRYGFALAALAKQPLRVVNIRATYDPPGLQAVHIHCIQLVCDVCHGRLEGGHVGSMECAFWPSDLGSGRFAIDTGSAASVTLLAQIALPCLIFSTGPSSFSARGGTDVRWFTPFDEVLGILIPLVASLGCEAQLALMRRGFFPTGGGEVTVSVPQPLRGACLRPLVLRDLGKVVRVEGRAFATAGTQEAAELQNLVLSTQEMLSQFLPGVPVEIHLSVETPTTAVGHASALTLLATTDTGCRLGGTHIRGTERPLPPAEDARLAIEKLATAVRSQGCLDEFTQDQAVLYMALAGGHSEVRVGGLTEGTKAAIAAVEAILPCRFQMRADGATHILSCDGIGLIAQGRFTASDQRGMAGSNPFSGASQANPFSTAPSASRAVFGGPVQANPFKGGSTTTSSSFNSFGPSATSSSSSNPFGPKVTSGAAFGSSAASANRPFDAFGGYSDRGLDPRRADGPFGKGTESRGWGFSATDSPHDGGADVKRMLELLVSNKVLPHYDANLYDRLMALGRDNALDLLQEVARRDMSKIQNPIPYIIGMIRNRAAERGLADDRGGWDRGDGFLGGRRGGGGGSEVRRMVDMLVTMGKIPFADDGLLDRLMSLPRDDALDVLEEVLRRDMSKIRAPIPYIFGMIRHLDEERGGERGDRDDDRSAHFGRFDRMRERDVAEIRRMLELLVSHRMLPHYDDRLMDRLLALPKEDAMDILKEVLRRDMAKIRAPIPYVIGMIRAREDELGGRKRDRDGGRDSDSDDDDRRRRDGRDRRDGWDMRRERNATAVLLRPNPFGR